MLTANTIRPYLVRLKRLELLILAAADFKSAVYTIPPQSHIFGGEGGNRTHLPLEATDLQSAVLPLEHLLRLKNNYIKIKQTNQI